MARILQWKIDKLAFIYAPLLMDTNLDESNKSEWKKSKVFGEIVSYYFLIFSFHQRMMPD